MATRIIRAKIVGFQAFTNANKALMAKRGIHAFNIDMTASLNSYGTCILAIEEMAMEKHGDAECLDDVLDVYGMREEEDARVVLDACGHASVLFTQ